MRARLMLVSVMRHRAVALRMRSRKGFTLLEIMAVLVIFAFASALAVPAFRKFVEEDDMTKATRRMEALFRIARDSAVRSGVPVTVVIDSVSSKVWFDVATQVSPDSAYAQPGVLVPANRSVRMGSGRMRAGVAAADHVVVGEDLGLPESVTLGVTRARARFEFSPSGASFPDTLFLRWTLGERMITVHRWTGDILVF
jgi:prepilin-type N-terminal cleavage/methylation domain-containing protein